jgi:DNA uptake protein ComE-like DNA-binding protein
MPTSAERKALLFLAGVIVLGASVRVVRAARHDRRPDAATRQALSRQLAAVDSASDAARQSSGTRAAKGTGTRKRRGPPATRVTLDSSSASHRGARDRASPPGRDSSPPLTQLVDLDVASEEEIEKLPRIGPVLARRIVDDRAANGSFGSLDGLERVRGVGPALAASLGSRVTFSGTARPSNALAHQRLRRLSPTSEPRRRGRDGKPGTDCVRVSCRY